MMKVKDIKDGHEVTFAIPAIDYGLPEDISDEIVENFCKEMIGKEKNLHIETSGNTIKKSREDSNSSLSPEKLQDIHDGINHFPIDQVMNTLYLDEQQEKKDEG